MSNEIPREKKSHSVSDSNVYHPMTDKCIKTEGIVGPFEIKDDASPTKLRYKSRNGTDGDF